MDDKLLAEIAEDVNKSSNNLAYYDTWGDDVRTNKFKYLKTNLCNYNINGFKVNDDIYVVTYRPAGYGVDEPNSIIVKCLVMFN